MQYPKRSEELSLELPISLDFKVFAVQPNIVTWSIVSKLCSFIVVSFLELFSMKEVFATYDHQFSKVNR